MEAFKSFNKRTSQRHLTGVFMAYVAQSTARGRDGTSPDSLTSTLPDVVRLVQRKLRSNTYRFTPYRQLLISRGATRRPRVLSLPTARDRVALRALADILLDVFPEARPLIPQATARQVRSAISTTTFNYYIRLDIEDFYPSIQHEQVRRCLRSRIRKRELVDVLLRAIATPTLPDGHHPCVPVEQGLPQGLAISNVLAELAVGSIDQAMQGRSDCNYFRFVDDILIVCDAENAPTIEKLVKNLCDGIGLTCHDQKSAGGKSLAGQLAEGVEYLGYVFYPGRVSVRERSVRDTEAAIVRVLTAYKHEVREVGTASSGSVARCLWRVNLVITGCRYKGKSLGWLHYFQEMTDLSLLKRLDLLVVKLLGRFGLSGTIKPKTFLTAYYKIQTEVCTATSYSPNLDAFDTTVMRRQLVKFFPNEHYASKSDSEVRRAYFRMVDRTVRRFAIDISIPS